MRARLWTVVTYMFVHGSFWHLVVNMYGLWLFGTRVERVWGAGSFVRYYLLCGLGGWLAHLIFFRQHGYLIGASAAVLGARRRPVAVVSVWGSAHRVPHTRLGDIARRTRQAADEIEALLS
jgi:hypothetical protein